MLNFNRLMQPSTTLLNIGKQDLENIKNSKDLRNVKLDKYTLLFEKALKMRNKDSSFDIFLDNYAKEFFKICRARVRSDKKMVEKRTDTKLSKSALKGLKLFSEFQKGQKVQEAGESSSVHSVLAHSEVNEEEDVFFDAVENQKKEGFDPTETKNLALKEIEGKLGVVQNESLRKEVNETLKNFISPLTFFDQAVVSPTADGFSVTIPCDQAMRGEIRPSSKIIFDPCVVPKEGKVSFTVHTKGEEVVVDLNEHVQMRGIEGERFKEVVSNVASKLPNTWPLNYAKQAKEGMEKAVNYPSFYQNFRFRMSDTGGVQVKAKLKEAQGEEKKVREEQRGQLGAVALKMLDASSASSASLARLALFESDDRTWADANLINRLFRTQENDQDLNARVLGWDTLI